MRTGKLSKDNVQVEIVVCDTEFGSFYNAHLKYLCGVHLNSSTSGFCRCNPLCDRIRIPCVTVQQFIPLFVTCVLRLWNGAPLRVRHGFCNQPVKGMVKGTCQLTTEAGRQMLKWIQEAPFPLLAGLLVTARSLWVCRSNGGAGFSAL